MPQTIASAAAVASTRSASPIQRLKRSTLPLKNDPATANPFDEALRAEWRAFKQQNSTRKQLSTYQYDTILKFLADPSLKPHNNKEKSLKHQAREQYEVENNKLYRYPKEEKRGSRVEVIKEKEYLDTMIQCHMELHHAGRDKLYPHMQKQYYGASRDDCQWIIDNCKVCVHNRADKSKAPLQPIIVSKVWERLQIDLIDFRHEPCGQYKWVLHVKDHFSKYSLLFPLKSKHATPIADCIAQVIMCFGPSQILQADNGKEFKGALLILLRKWGIRVMNGAPRSPHVQGLVEQGNSVVKQKIRAWKKDNNSKEWVYGLVDIANSINKQKHSTTKMSPYEIVFRKRASFAGWTPPKQRVDKSIGVPQEDPELPDILEADFEEGDLPAELFAAADTETPTEQNKVDEEGEGDEGVAGEDMYSDGSERAEIDFNPSQAAIEYADGDGDIPDNQEDPEHRAVPAAPSPPAAASPPASFINDDHPGDPEWCVHGCGRDLYFLDPDEHEEHEAICKGPRKGKEKAKEVPQSQQIVQFDPLVSKTHMYTRS